MNRLSRTHVFHNYGDLSTLPRTPPLSVKLDEQLVLETVDTSDRHVLSRDDIDKPRGPMAGNPCTGPVHVEHVRAGDVIAVRIEQIDVVGHCVLDVAEEALLPAELREKRRDFIAIENRVAPVSYTHLRAHET